MTSTDSAVIEETPGGNAKDPGESRLRRVRSRSLRRCNGPAIAGKMASMISLCAIAMLLAACVEPEILEARDGTVPVNVDLSGNWILQNDTREDRARLMRAVRNTDGMDEADIFRAPTRPSNGSRNNRVKGGLVDVFLEVGEALKITQTEHALFISFDRAIVEEFRFGEYRIVNVGPIQAQRTTGWEGDQLVVETLDKNSMKLIDRFQLTNDGNTLERNITFRSEEGVTESIVQRFDRRE